MCVLVLCGCSLELELVGLPYGRAIEWFARAMWLVAWIGVEKRGGRGRGDAFLKGVDCFLSHKLRLV
jgi:hypothetical protein